MKLFVFALCLASSAIGGICGVGGGVIIKPVLDALGVLGVSAVSFLSGLTVLSMALVSVLRRRQEHLLELRTGSLLVAGAVLGGLLGSRLFEAVKTAAENDLFAGAVQALVLGAVTLLTLLYHVSLRKRLPGCRIRRALGTAAIGLAMGALSSFLGIGGGPVNVAVLCFAFSMDTRTAAANSLYIILFSQLASFLSVCIRGEIPEFSAVYLPIMVSAGILGGILGTEINRRITAAAVEKLFTATLSAMLVICLYNACHLYGLSGF